MKRLVVFAIAAAAVAVAVPLAASAGGGNSDAAHVCQRGGWQSFYRSDGSAFTNTGACVSYAAQGGELETLCRTGTWSLTGVTPCSPADVGYYVDTTGATSETPCPAGETTHGAGSTSIAECYSAGPPGPGGAY